MITSQTAVYRCTYCKAEMPGPAMIEQPSRQGRGKEWRPAGLVPGQCGEHDGVHHPECCQAAAQHAAAQQAAELARASEADAEPWWKTPVLSGGTFEPEPSPPGITRSGGYPVIINGMVAGLAGSGYRGCTAELDAVVAQAAELLAAEYHQSVEIRFNSDRERGGAWLVTPDGRNDQVGINAGVVTARHRAQTERHATRAETMARTGICTWGGEATPSQCEGARACAEHDRAWLADNPEGLMRIDVLLALAAVPAYLHAELEQLPGWVNPGRYHIGDVPNLRAALSRCMRFAPAPGGAR
jgi:hypothetical protein